MRHRHEERDKLNTKMVKLLIEILFSSRILLPQLIRTENPLKNAPIVYNFLFQAYGRWIANYFMGNEASELNTESLLRIFAMLF